MSAAIGTEFREIGHCGGEFSVTTRTEADGRRSFSVGVKSSSPKPAALFMVGALEQGIPFVTMEIGGWAPDRADEPPQEAVVLPVMIASDEHGLFGHRCPRCNGYWRSDAAPARWPLSCPYCGLQAATHRFLTEGQCRFVERCCKQILEAINAEEDGKHVIDMDRISDEIAKGADPPPFYYSETSQQSSFRCDVCGRQNDILGKYGYCSCCGSRNNLQLFDADISVIMDSLQKGDPTEECVKRAVSQFDACGRNYLVELARRVPMMPKRKKAVERLLLHDPERNAENLATYFGIALFKDMSELEQAFLKKMFARRHVYEHNAGVADAKYLKKSGDTSVKVGQAIRESKANAERLITLVVKMATNLHGDFHEIFPPNKTAVAMCGGRGVRRKEKQR